MQFNRVELAGNLVCDPELRYTQSGTPLCTITLAVNRSYGGEEKKEDVLFQDCVAFGKTAEFLAQYFSKGKNLFIEGRLQSRQWEADDGQKRSKTEVVVERAHFVGKPNE